MSDLPVYILSGGPGEMGRAHGAAVRELLEPAFVDRYLDTLGAVLGFTREDLSVQARSWLGQLPANLQEEIAGMADGARVTASTAAEFLYADIARATTTSDAIAGSTAAPPPGPMCSSTIARLDCGATWIARNCDWLTPTLTRGTACVVHETTGRIPIAAVGIRGDIDVDTGMNAERLWLHLHTLRAVGDPPRDRTCISWLFWAREALETCASLDDLERFIERTGRDRGVLAIAGDGKTGEAAIFECGPASHTRHDVDPARPACATNHPPARTYQRRAPDPTASGTINRLHALERTIESEPPRRGPDDLIRALAADGVEMRTPKWLRTIYSAVACPREGAIWFAAGRADGAPAASRGRWSRVALPW